jgi:hypothetical protein
LGSILLLDVGLGGYGQNCGVRLTWSTWGRWPIVEGARWPTGRGFYHVFSQATFWTYIRVTSTKEDPEVFEETNERYSLGRGWSALPLKRYIVASWVHGSSQKW